MTVVLLVVSASIASANTLYPSGCHKHAHGLGTNGWDSNCWLGENGSAYINDAAYVQGTQIILKGFGYYTLSIDGLFGDGTLAAVKLYQSHERLSVDGVVGDNTWHHLRGELFFQFYQCSPVNCWWVYSSPGTIGTNRWAVGDFNDAFGHYGPWSYVWSGFSVGFGDNPPV